MKVKYRIKETHYGNSTIKYFAQKLINNKWKNIQNILGYDIKESASNDIFTYHNFYNPNKEYSIYHPFELLK